MPSVYRFDGSPDGLSIERGHATERTSEPVYKRYFGSFTPQDPETYRRALEKLGGEMTKNTGFDQENPAIPAGYTYLGQFLAHEMSHMDLRTDSGGGPSVRNLVTPGLDLDSVFPHPKDPVANACDECKPMTIGLTLGLKRYRSDLPRLPDGTPIMKDCRADDVLPLAQLTVLFLKFANALSKVQPFDAVQDLERETARRFQSIILHDYLKRLIDEDTYKDVLKNGRVIVAPGEASKAPDFHLPLEFTAAIFRFGHAMVRKHYPFWTSAESANLRHFWKQTFNSKPPDSVFEGLTSSWATNWKRLFDVPGSMCGTERCVHLNSARINTKLARVFSQLPPQSLPEDEPSPSNLAIRTLKRAYQLKLATAQQALEQVNDQLKDSGRKKIEILTPDDLQAGEDEGVAAALKDNDELLLKKTPLWFYVLKEADVRADGLKLGPFASRIVMETVHAAIEKTPGSIQTHFPELDGEMDRKFKMADLLKLVEDNNPLERCLPKLP